MVYTRQNDHYDVRLAGDLLRACENGTADFLNPITVPYYTQNMITNQVLSDTAQLQTLLNNAAYGSQYINYAPTYIFQDSKKEFMENMDKNDRGVGCITYKGKDENGNKLYEMMTPAGRINPGGINESPMTQSPVPNIGICRYPASYDPSDPKNIEKYITDVIGNYFNAAFTKTPYYPPAWGARETDMLSKALNADPSLAMRMAQQAYAQATSVKIENTVNQELNNNVREAMKQGLPPFNTKKQDAIIGPVNINGNGIPTNGIDFINAYYKGNNGASKSDTAQNGYIPYQTHNENPKNIDRFLVEEYSNIINASLTGKPYSGSITPAQLKALTSGIEAKMANNPAYMSGIVNQAQQNVLGFNYMPYNKEAFIAKAQDPSSSEFKLMNQMIANHVKDICMNNKQSFNGDFQELSKDLTDKLKKTNTAQAAKKPSTRTSTAGQAKTPSTKTSTTAQTKTPLTKASTAAQTKTSSTKASTAAQAKTPSTKANTATQNVNPPVAPIAETKEERPSFLREVTDFVTKNIVEKKPALVLVDTVLGAMVDKAKRIVMSGTVKTVSAAYNIAEKVTAPDLKTANNVSKSVTPDPHKPAAHRTARSGQTRQNQQAKTSARR
jgi:mannose/fructose-specific phosphotransferase system component IIA